jgi:hypothetical protein
MKKIIKIEFCENNQIICHFDNNELRIIDLSKTIKDKYITKILSDETIFKSAKIGEFGELYWANAAEIKDLNGKIIPCEYDISPEFAYYNSKPFHCT